MRKKAQGTMEYIVLIAVIVGALLAMQVYMKRAVQGRMKSYAEQLNVEKGYSPGITTANISLTKTINEDTSSYAEDDPQSEDPDDKIYITENSARISQEISRKESIMPFGNEPRR